MSNDYPYSGPNRERRYYQDNNGNNQGDRAYRNREIREYDPKDREMRMRDTRGSDPRIRRHNDYREENYRDQRYGDRGYYQRGRANDKYASRREKHSNRGDIRREKREPHTNPDAALTKEEKIAKYEKILADLLKHPTVNAFPIKNSQWGVRPKGFEEVTAQRAKLSGLFPLPGTSNTSESPKLDLALKEGSAKADVLLSTSKIDPLDSKNSHKVIVGGVDFLKIPHSKLIAFIDKYITSVDLKGTFLDTNIEKSQKTPDNSKVIIQFKNSICATVAMTLNGKSFSVDESGIAASNDKFVARVERPGEYVVQCLPPYSSEEDIIQEDVIDSPRKLTLFISALITESELIDELQKVAKVRAFKLLRAIGTKESLGVAFVEFYVNPQEYPNTKTALKLITNYAQQIRKLDIVKEVSFSCIGIGEDNKVETSIQDCPIDFKTLKAMVRNEYVQFHPKLKVIQLINIVTPTELFDEETYKFMAHDIMEEAKLFGTVVSFKIPKPGNEPLPGVQPANEPGVGKVFIEFQDEKVALNAIMGLAGRSYNDRTVICAFYSHSDYLKGLL